MAGQAGNQLLLAVILAANAQVQAQSLGEPAPVKRMLDVAQFGVPRDAKYIFCDGQDCPDRTRKTLTSPQPLPTAHAVVVPPQPQSMPLPAEFSSTNVKSPRTHMNKVVRKKRIARLDCGPVITK
jgi:hypothetical protein